MKKSFAIGLMLALIVVLGVALTPNTVMAAGTGTVTVEVKDSTGAPLAGAKVMFLRGGQPDQDWGSTTSTGILTGVLPATGTWNVEVTYGNTKVSRKETIGTDPVTLTFQTSLITVKLETCQGVGLEGGKVRSFGNVSSGSPFTFGTTGPGGTVSREMFPGNWRFDVEYKQTKDQKQQDVSVDPVVTFRTTKVTLIHSGAIRYRGNPSSGTFFDFTKPSMEMLPGTIKFDFQGIGEIPLTISGCDFTGGFLTLIDEAGNPMANYPADYPAVPANLSWKYRCGGSWGPTTSFQTDAYGKTLFSIGCANWDKKLTMTLNQTSIEQNEVELGLTNYTFQAAKVNANLKTCTAPITDVPGGTVAQGGGYWYNHGVTGPSGTVSFYTFPTNTGTIKVRMSYNHMDQTLYPTIAAGTNNVDFTTTALTFTYAGDIKSNTGGSWWMFNKPTMNLLPGDYNFYFQSGSNWIGPVTVSMSGCAMNKALLRVVDENGNGVAGAKATPAIGGSWQPQIPGATDANGNLFVDYNPAWTKIKMTVNGNAREQTSAQLQASNYTWTTDILRVGLLDHAGVAITDQLGVLELSAGSWLNLGNLNASGYRDIQLFAPGNYKFRMTYNYTTQELIAPLTGGPGIETFNFQTGQAVGACITQYSAGAWRTFTNPMELMPGTYTFKNPSQSGTITAGGVTNLNCGP